MAVCTSIRNRAEVKFYYGVKGTSLEDADAKSEALGKEVLAMIDKNAVKGCQKVPKNPEKQGKVGKYT